MFQNIHIERSPSKRGFVISLDGELVGPEMPKEAIQSVKAWLEDSSWELNQRFEGLVDIILDEYRP